MRAFITRKHKPEFVKQTILLRQMTQAVPQQAQTPVAEPVVPETPVVQPEPIMELPDDTTLG